MKQVTLLKFIVSLVFVLACMSCSPDDDCDAPQSSITPYKVE